MNQNEVELLLGGPSGDYGYYTDWPGVMTMEGWEAPRDSIKQTWLDDTHMIHVYFNAKGTVVYIHEQAGYKRNLDTVFWSMKPKWRRLLTAVGL